MVTLTKSAREALMDMLRENTKSEGSLTVLRLVETEEGKFEVKLDLPTSLDTVIEHHGQKLLVLDKNVTRKLDDAVIDVDKSSPGGKLVFRRSQIPQ